MKAFLPGSGEVGSWFAIMQGSERVAEHLNPDWDCIESGHRGCPPELRALQPHLNFLGMRG